MLLSFMHRSIHG